MPSNRIKRRATIAVTFLYGKAWREQYLLDLINNPTVAGLAARSRGFSGRRLGEALRRKMTRNRRGQNSGRQDTPG